MSDERPTHLDLFSGIGGFALAAQWAGFRTVAFCELEHYCQAVLKKNFGAVADSECVRSLQSEGGKQNERRRSCDSSPKLFSNIFDFDGRPYRGITLITGGFPCQPFSVAGKRRGAADDRHLWPEMLRIITEARPAWVLGENVPGIIGMELDNVLSQLEAISYAGRPFTIPACAVDAKHRRDRLWILYRDISNSRYEQPSGRHEAKEGLQYSGGREARSKPASCSCTFRDSAKQGFQNGRGSSVGNPEREIAESKRSNRDGGCRWLPEPGVGRVANGVPNRVDRLRGLGNAIVPQVAYQILKAIQRASATGQVSYK